jgi:hypothetical protein
MRTDDLLLRVECYVAVRKALGYAVRSEEKLLKDFVQFLELNGASSPIRAQTAIEWACAPAPGRGPSGEASRLKVVRRFLSHLQAFERFVVGGALRLKIGGHVLVRVTIAVGRRRPKSATRRFAVGLHRPPESQMT